jgi:hypothetical protein
MFPVGGAPLVDPRSRHHDKDRRGQEQDQRAKGQDGGSVMDTSLGPTTAPRGRGLLQASLRSLACSRATNPAFTRTIAPAGDDPGDHLDKLGQRRVQGA